MTEAQAKLIFLTAIMRGRAAELLMALFDGAGVTLNITDPFGDGSPDIIIIPRSEIERVTEEAQ